MSRIVPYGGGYRVWLDRGRSPFFVPHTYFRRYPLSVGLSIRFGSYWDPLGYYNVYDVGPYDGSYASDGLRGIVETVDYRRGEAVLRDDNSGRIVRAVLDGRDPGLGELRPGDYVDLTGTWSRSGVFEADSIVDLRRGGYDRAPYDDPRNDPRYDPRDDPRN